MRKFYDGALCVVGFAIHIGLFCWYWNNRASLGMYGTLGFWVYVYFSLCAALIYNKIDTVLETLKETQSK